MSAKDRERREKLIKSYRTKRCPYCHAHLDLKATRCNDCGRKVGEVTEHGAAQKPFDWKAYLMAAVAIGAFVGFIWWAFLRG